MDLEIDAENREHSTEYKWTEGKYLFDREGNTKMDHKHSAKGKPVFISLVTGTTGGQEWTWK
jgi:hypothetical protein